MALPAPMWVFAVAQNRRGEGGCSQRSVLDITKDLPVTLPRRRSRAARTSAARARRHRRGAIRWQALVFLIGFTVLLVGILAYVLAPGLEAARHATDNEKRSLVAWYRLLLAVLLLILFSGLMLTFRVGRFFFPRPTGPRTRTRYVDAWAESARRMEVPARDGGDTDDDPMSPPSDPH